MPTEIVVAVVSLLGTLVGSLGGILTASHLTAYRIEQLEKKVEKHNSVVERVALLEQDQKTQWTQIEGLKSALDELERIATTLNSINANLIDIGDNMPGSD